MKVATRCVLSITFVLALTLCMSLLGSVSASAEVIHNFEFSFDGSATTGGSFEGALGAIALDQASGDVYVDDYETEAVYRFDATGKYLGVISGDVVPQGSFGLLEDVSGLAVDNSAGPNKGDLYVAGTNNGVVYRFDSSGKLLAEFNGAGTPAGSGSFAPRGVAVDTSGDLYVADADNDVVDKFNSSGAYMGQITSPDITSPRGIAVDSSGNVYLNNEEPSNVIKLEPGGTSSVLDANRSRSVAVDPATENIYISEPKYPVGAIAEYDSSGARLGSFGDDRLGVQLTVAVYGATDKVYVADNNNNLIAVFGPAVVVPDVVTSSASDVHPASATFNGTVNPDSLPASGCLFEYGTGTSYGQSTPCEQSPASIGSGTSPVPVSAQVSGLQSDSEYHYRLVASNANGTNDGADVSLATPGPPRVLGESTTDIARTVATLQATIDPFGLDTSYHFEYGTGTSYGTSVPVSDADIGSSMSEVPVGQEISGLSTGTIYHYRVVATNPQGTVDGPDQTFATVPPAYIDAEYATNVASTSATVNAEVNPIGSSTAYRIEFGTSPSYGETFVGTVGEGTGDVLVSDHIQELQSGTTYHYRVVTSNSFGAIEGSDHTFTTQTSGGEELTLPDGRTWEMVSPPDKKGSLIEPFQRSLIQAADNGNAISYLSTEAIGEDPMGKSGSYSQILSTRVPGGWRSQDISIPHSLPPETESAQEMLEVIDDYWLFSSNLSQAVVEPFGVAPPLSPEANERTIYLRNSTNGSYLPIVSPANVTPGIKFGGTEEGEFRNDMHFLAGTPDLSHIVLESPFPLTPESIAPECPSPEKQNGFCLYAHPMNLYEWSGGYLQLVNILPDGKPLELSYSDSARAYLGVESDMVAHAISSEGRWIVWHTGSKSTGSINLYVRDMVGKKTFSVGGPGAIFQTMSSDGSKVFYLENDELYDFDTETDTQIDLTADHDTGESSASVQDAIVGASEDGSYVYFVAKGALASGAVAGEDNLYVLHENGDEWTTTYITTLSSEDQANWFPPELCAGGAPGASCPVVLGRMTSKVSPDGQYVAFMSDRALTGYDNLDAVSDQPDEEVYLYDAVADRVVCASCDPTGARPVGLFDTSVGEGPVVDKALAWGHHWIAGNLPGWRGPWPFGKKSQYQPRSLSDSGRLLFNSPDALVPQDTDGLEDVYEYEPPGIGTCTSSSTTFSPRSGGCVDLISSGTSSGESAFLDASENGNDVFFVTPSRLTAADYDTSEDVYDAHVCSTEAPCSSSPVSSPSCTSGDSCKAAPSPQPEIFGPAPSATFSGAGNVVEGTKKSVVKHKIKPKPRKHAKRRKRKAKKPAGKSRTVRAMRKGNR